MTVKSGKDNLSIQLLLTKKSVDNWFYLKGK